MSKQLSLAAPPAVLEIARTLERHGYATWAVGGAVRDALLGSRGGDWDLATSARPKQVRRAFRRTIPLGIEHGTVGVLGKDGVLYEVTTFRRDVETFGRHAVVEFADRVEDDLARRDFTMNAIAWHPLREELLDPFDGASDLRSHVLRTVGDPGARFAEDYLRVLRALRFAGQFQLEIESATWSALQSAVARLVDLSAERVREELIKVLANTRHASKALDLYARSGALAVLYPELQALVDLEVEFGDGGPPPAGPSAPWSRTLCAIDAAAPGRPRVRLAVLMHGLGLPAARTRDLRGGWRFTGHEQIGARKAGAVMRRLKASNADRERVAMLVSRQSDLFPPDAPPAGIRRWLRDITPELVPDLFRLRIALYRADTELGDMAPEPNSAEFGRGAMDIVSRWRSAHAVLLAHPVLDVAGLAIGGHDLADLGIARGPRYGEILRGLVDLVIEDPSLNTRERLLDIVRDEVGQ